MMWNNSLYSNYRQRKFTDIWDNVDSFIEDYNNNGIPALLKDPESIKTLYYLLYARYGNSTIASSDEYQFKLKLFSIVFQYGPTWEKKLEIQKKLRTMEDDELLESAKAIYNHSYNPSTIPSTKDTEELPTVNDQNVTKHKRSKLDAYSILMELLKNDVSGEFLNKFKKLFLAFVEPELPLWYITQINSLEQEY